MLKIIKFGAQWCRPCHQMDKVMDEVLSSYDTNIVYTKVDIEEEIDFTAQHKVMSVPTMIFEYNGEVVCRLTGTRSGNEIKTIIDQYVK